MFILVILIPPFVLWRIPELTGSIGFAISAVFAVFILLFYVSMKEFQYPKASALLCTTPYPRSMIVVTKYGFCVTIFAVCSVIYWIETLLLPKLGSFHFEMVIATFAGISLLISIYLPIQFKIGYEKTKFFFVVIIMASPFLLPQLSKISSDSYLVIINSASTLFLCVMVVLVNLILLVASIFISIKIYNQKDLI
jgi:hypothetical protein